MKEKGVVNLDVGVVSVLGQGITGRCCASSVSAS